MTMLTIQQFMAQEQEEQLTGMVGDYVSPSRLSLWMKCPLDEDVEQSGFSATIRTDESDFVSCAEGEAGIDEYRFGRKVATEMFDR